MSELILIVDDDIWVCSNLQAYFEDEGFQVLVASSGEDGLALMREVSPVLAIVDMRLPMMDGNEFIFRANQVNAGMRFLIHTGSVEYEMPEVVRDIRNVSRQIFYKPLTNMGLLLDEVRSKDAA